MMDTINNPLKVALSCSLLMVSSISAFAQSKKFVPGYFEDTKGNKMMGLIQTAPSGKGPVKGQAFIAFKEDENANKIELSAGDLRYFVAGKDSFVVAAAPMNADWGKNEVDFIQVLADEPLKVYVLHGTKGGSGFGISPGFSAGFGGGSYGGYGGGGVGISIGGGPGGGRSKTTYYFGASPAELTQITPQNFIDVMSDILADDPQLVQQVQAGKYNLSKMALLLAQYHAHKKQLGKPL